MKLSLAILLCLILGTVHICSAAGNTFFAVDIFAGPTCQGDPVTASWFPYIDECMALSDGQIKFSAADDSAVTMCLFDAPVDQKGCNAASQQTCINIAYGGCQVLPKTGLLQSFRPRRVIVNPDANPPTHYTVMAWDGLRCNQAPAGKLPAESPANNPLKPYPYRLIFNITDTSGTNPPAGTCESAKCSNNNGNDCWMWKTSVTSGATPSVNVCSNGAPLLTGANCGQATQCSTFALDRLTCQTPTNQPEVGSATLAHFDKVIGGAGGSGGNNNSAGVLSISAGVFILFLIVTM